jgi:hypothetical protein
MPGRVSPHKCRPLAPVSHGKSRRDRRERGGTKGRSMPTSPMPSYALVLTPKKVSFFSPRGGRGEVLRSFLIGIAVQLGAPPWNLVELPRAKLAKAPRRE